MSLRAVPVNANWFKSSVGGAVCDLVEIPRVSLGGVHGQLIRLLAAARADGSADVIVSCRVFVHGLAGCLFYGAFASKVLIVRAKGLPGWVLPVAGGLVFTGLVAAWLTSAFWFFNTQGFQFA